MQTTLDNYEHNFSLLSYTKEADLLIKWKAIPLRSLHYILPREIHKTYSYRLADKLVMAGVAHKVKCFRSKMFVLIPSRKAMDDSYQNFQMSQFSQYCRDSFVASALLTLPVFKNKNVRFRHEDNEYDSTPNKLKADFTIEGRGQKRITYNIGVFFESAHQSKGNSDERMMRFVDKENYDAIFLVFKTMDDLNKRRELYFESRDHKLGKELEKYVCLIHIEDYLSSLDELNQSYVYFQGEETTLYELFK